MNKREYTKQAELLEAQIAQAEAIVTQFDTAFADKMDHLTEAGQSVITDAWNAAHDVVSGLQGELRQLHTDWAGRNNRTSAATRELVAHNVD